MKIKVEKISKKFSRTEGGKSKGVRRFRKKNMSHLAWEMEELSGSKRISDN